MNPQDYIPKPCHEKWDSMNGSEKQKFCDKCACSVHNLTGMNHEQIMSLRSELGGKLCGAFKSPKKPVRRVHLKRNLIIGASISSLALAACQSEKDTAVIGEVPVEYRPESVTDPVKPPAAPEEPEELMGDICPIEPPPEPPLIKLGEIRPPEKPEPPKPEPQILGKICPPE